MSVVYWRSDVVVVMLVLTRNWPFHLLASFSCGMICNLSVRCTQAIKTFHYLELGCIMQRLC